MKVKHETGIAINILLALGSSSNGCTRAELAKKISVAPSQCYGILSKLCQQGMVESEQSAGDSSRCAYYLSKPADMISLNDIILLYEGEFLNAVCLYCKRGCRTNKSAVKCVFGQEMESLERSITSQMENTTIQDLINTDDMRS